MPSVSCFRHIIQALNMAWVGLQGALDHEAHEASSVVLTVCRSTAPCLGKGATLVADEL